MSSDWTKVEVEIIVSDYFKMLKKELQEVGYSKTDHRNKLKSIIQKRSHGSIEFKHQNISAILIELGMPSIVGYKPRYNYQNLLKTFVREFLNKNSQYFGLFDNYVESKIVAKKIENILSCCEERPIVDYKISDRISNFRNDSQIPNYYYKEIQNKKLGLLGEEFIIQFERARLINEGSNKFVDKIEHISKTVGDHAGYDILSFNKDGRERYIEVKTTRFAKESPFFFSRNELEFSQKKSDQYYIYRLFQFKSNPKLFLLPGDLERSCGSIPTQYIGWPI